MIAAAGTLTAGATPRTTASSAPAEHIASMAYTKTIPARRCSGAPLLR